MSDRQHVFGSAAGLAGRVALLLSVAIAAGVLANEARRSPLPWARSAAASDCPVVPLAAARQIVESRSQIVLDARGEAEFRAGRLPGAISLPVETVRRSFAEVQGFLLPAEPILVYCAGPTCDESVRLCRFLRDQGYTNVSVFADGISGWKSAGLPLEEG